VIKGLHSAEFAYLGKAEIRVKEQIKNFVDEVRRSLAAGTFLKLTLANYKGTEEHLQRISVRRNETKKGERLAFQSRYSTRDVVKNADLKDAGERIANYLENDFKSAHLFTTTNDFQLIVGKKSSRLTKGKATLKTAPPASHDREKNYLVDPSAYYLRALGITTDSGQVRSNQHDKWRQINKFVESVDGLIKNSPLRDSETLRVVDMGSGKGYLTFALYDHLARTGSGSYCVGSLQNPAQSKCVTKIQTTGVEQRKGLVTLCNEIAQASEFDGLKFVQGTIADHDPGKVDILIALHACDTATDDALYKGIAANASVIVAAPCCHHEVKKQLKPPELLEGVLKHPVMLERTAETITDGIRALLLEANGYKTKMFEFVSTEHTPKNNMLVATRVNSPHASKGSTNKKMTEVNAIMSEFGIKNQHLFALLNQKYENENGQS
jgi:hypothetical protein